MTRWLPLAVAALLLVGCASTAGVRSPGATAAEAPARPTLGTSDGPAGVTGDVVVFAAASLTDSFTALAGDFEAAHPGSSVVLSFAGSSALAQQIVSGAPADVFAAASSATMQVVVDERLLDTGPTVFARNRLQIVVPAGNPGDVDGLADLTDPDLTIALCDVQVPCGSAATQAFEAAGLTPAPDTLEQDVRAVLSKVRLGEVDAGLVYKTDVLVAGDAVQGIDVEEVDQAVNDYPIAVLAGAPNPTAAQAFVAYVLSDDGQRVLADAGFTAP